MKLTLNPQSPSQPCSVLHAEVGQDYCLTKCAFVCREGGVCQAFADSLKTVPAGLKLSAAAEEAVIRLKAPITTPVNVEPPKPNVEPRAKPAKEPRMPRPRKDEPKKNEAMLVLVETEKGSGVYARVEMTMADFITSAGAGRKILTASEWREW